jgi:hypothetical protein
MRFTALLLACVLPVSATWTVTQVVGPSGFGSWTGSPQTYAITVTSTTQSVGVMVYTGNASSHLSSISPGTWTECSACDAVSGSDRLSMYYTLSLPSGTTSFTGTSTGTGANLAFYELAATTAPCYDTGNGTHPAGSTQTNAAPSLTLNNSLNHVFIQGAYTNAHPQSINGSYSFTGTADSDAAPGVAFLSNATSYSAPTWTGSQVGATWYLSVLALYESGFSTCTPAAMPQILEFFDRSIRGYLAILTPGSAFSPKKWLDIRRSLHTQPVDGAEGGRGFHLTFPRAGLESRAA